MEKVPPRRAEAISSVMVVPPCVAAVIVTVIEQPQPRLQLSFLLQLSMSLRLHLHLLHSALFRGG